MKVLSTRLQPHRPEEAALVPAAPTPQQPSGLVASAGVAAPDAFDRARTSPFSAPREAPAIRHPRIPRKIGSLTGPVDDAPTTEFAPSSAALRFGGLPREPIFSAPGQKADALEALRVDPGVYDKVGEPLASDPDILFEAARLSAFPERILGRLPEALKQDRAWLMRMVRHNVWALNVVPDALLQDPKFLTDAAMAFPPILDDSKFSGSRDALLAGSAELRERYASVKSALHSLRIDAPLRLRSSELLDEVLRNRLEARASGDGRPTAVLVYAKQDTDHNGSLKGHNIDELTKHYRVMFYEARTEQDFIDAVKEGGRTDAAALVAVDGHGSRTALNLGEAVWQPDVSAREEHQIDLGDEAQLREAHLEKHVRPDATILLEACSNGYAGGKAKNPANMFARLFPGREVIAPTRPVEVIKIRLDGQGRVAGPSWTVQGTNTYRVRGRTARTTGRPTRSGVHHG